MIDTVILIVPEDRFRVTRYESFFEDKAKNNEKNKIGVCYKSSLKSKTKYYPKLSITPRRNFKGDGVIRDLKIEFSVPKLIFQSNLKELSITDQDCVYSTLIQRLKEMGVELYCHPSIFEVMGFDTGKNIFLNKGVFSHQIIKELSKCNVDRRLDLDNKNYREGSGSTLQFYSNSHSLVIYDKLADLKKKAKRSTDKDRNDLNSILDPSYDKQKQEILRIEVRLRNKIKMKKVMRQIGYKVDCITFDDLFNERLWRLIVSHYWKYMIVDKNRFLYSMTNKIDLFIEKLSENNPNIKHAEFLKLIGMFYLAREEGFPKYREIFEHKIKGSNWSKFIKGFEELNNITKTPDCYKWFRELDKMLSFDH